jgi:hypothetical protein
MGKIPGTALQYLLQDNDGRDDDGRRGEGCVGGVAGNADDGPFEEFDLLLVALLKDRWVAGSN